jgi:hypothetical protein
MTVGIVIQFAAWLASFGLLGVVVVRYEQADAAQEKACERMGFEPT